MRTMKNISSSPRLPASFKPLLWSYDFAALDPEMHKKAIIVNTINYGDLTQWRWIIAHYGKEAIREILATLGVESEWNRKPG